MILCDDKNLEHIIKKRMNRVPHLKRMFHIARKYAIYQAREDGETFKSIGKRFSIGGTRARQIWWQINCVNQRYQHRAEAMSEI